MNINYQKELDKIIDKIKVDSKNENFKKPTLLLHACCAPCSSYCIEYLEPFFDITLYFYNPNIVSENEYSKRASELIRLVEEMKLSRSVSVIVNEYDNNEFYNIAKGLEKEPERGKRCRECFVLRLDNTASYASNNKFDYFTTTLTISPHKDAKLINELGMIIAEKYNIKYLYSDFKKKNGYKRSIELSKEYDLYRQDFCGCIYSKVARQKEIQSK